MEASRNHASNSVDSIAGVALFVLTQLKSTASSETVPVLKLAACEALKIVTDLQREKANRSAVSQLLRDSCDLVYVVINLYNAQKDDGGDFFTDDGDKLVKILKDLQLFSQKMAKRRGFFGVIAQVCNNKVDVRQIKGYRGEIRRCSDMFWLKASDRVRTELKVIANSQVDQNTQQAFPPDTAVADSQVDQNTQSASPPDTQMKQDVLTSSQASFKQNTNEKPEKESNIAVDSAFGVNSFVLTQLQVTASTSPIPFLGSAAVAALNIISNAQVTKFNKGVFAQLAKASCELVYVVITLYDRQTKDVDGMNWDLNEDPGGLVSTLQEIEAFSREMVKRRGIVRSITLVWDRADDMERIQDYYQRIAQSLNIIWVKTSDRVRSQLQNIAAKEVGDGFQRTDNAPNGSNATYPISTANMSVLANVDHSISTRNIIDGMKIYYIP